MFPSSYIQELREQAVSWANHLKKNPDTPSSQAGVKMIYCRLIWQPTTLHTLWEELRDYWKMHSERTLTPERSKVYTQGNCYPSVVSPLMWDAMTCNSTSSVMDFSSHCRSRNLCLQVGKQQESLLGWYSDYTVTTTLAADQPPISHHWKGELVLWQCTGQHYFSE